jgi:hypothetical protein
VASYNVEGVEDAIMRLIHTAVLVALGSTSTWAAADAKLLGLLMPEAKMVAGVQIGQAKASPFGQFVLSQAGPNAEFDKLKAATGFDPRTDLTEMVAGSAANGGGLVAGHGAFQPAQLANLATAAGAPTENYKGITLIGGGNAAKGPAEDSAVAFLDGSTVLIGNRDLVKSAVDRWISGVRATGALSAKASEVSATSQAWAVATGLSELQGQRAPNAPPEAQMVQNVLAKINQVSGGLNFGETITLHGQALTGSVQDAQALADVVQFVMSMAGSKSPVPVLPQVNASGSAVNFTLTLTEQQAEQMFRPAVAARGAMRH